MTEISSLMDQLPVYTRTGTYVGQVRNAILDLDAGRIEAILVTRTNQSLVEGGLDVAVPYRWVADYDDVLVLRYFPESVQRAAAETETTDDEFIEVTA